MSFEKEFPSLNGKEIKILRYEAKDDYIGEYSGSDYTGTLYFVHRVIQEHTIDKQRVKEWLESKCKRPRAEGQDCRRQAESANKRACYKVVLEEMTKELGLE